MDFCLGLKTRADKQSYSLNDRLRLFEGTVTPTFLHGRATWTVTAETQKRIHTVQRIMLCMVIGTPRAKQQQNNHRPSRNQSTNNDNQHTEDRTRDTMPADAAAETTATTTIADNAHDENDDDVESNCASDHGDDSASNGESPNDDNLEPWLEGIQRATREAELKISRIGVEDWTVQQRRRKWKWAARIANQDCGRWSKSVPDWQPQLD